MPRIVQGAVAADPHQVAAGRDLPIAPAIASSRVGELGPGRDAITLGVVASLAGIDQVPIAQGHVGSPQRRPGDNVVDGGHRGVRLVVAEMRWRHLAAAVMATAALPLPNMLVHRPILNDLDYFMELCRKVVHPGPGHCDKMPDTLNRSL